MEDKEYLKLINDYPEIKIFLEDISKTISIIMVPVLELLVPIFEPINTILETIDNTFKKIIQQLVLEYIKSKKDK